MAQLKNSTTIGGNTFTVGTSAYFISTGEVGIGTNSVTGAIYAVYGGNIRIGTTNTGLIFPDGSFQTSAATGTSPGGSTGAVQYRTSGGTFGGTETTFYFDTATNRLGIGTNATSASTLTVKGDAPTWLNTTNSGAPELIIGTSTTTGLVLGQSSAATYGYIKSASSDTNPIISFTSTGVGIKNVTAPVNALDVAGGVVIGGGIAYAGTATAPSNGMLVQGTVGIGTSSTTGIPASNALAVFSSMYVTGGVYSNGLLRAGSGLSVTSGGATITGATTITGNLSITGNVIVTGNINTINSNVLVVNDPIIYIGESNPANTYDMGIVASYTSSTYRHTGMVRNQSDGVWTFFDNLVTEPSSTVNWNQPGLLFANTKMGNVIIAGSAASSGTTSGALIVTGGAGISGDMNVGGNITGTWNGTTISVAKGGTGLTSGTSGGVLYYSAAGTLASSGALAANALVIGGGAGAAPSTITTGTGVVTALGIAVGSAGAFVTFNGALGTPSSGTLTNCTFPTLNQNTTGYAAGIAGGATGQIVYQTAANTSGFVGVGTAGYALTGNGAASPIWTQFTNANTASTIVQRDASGNFSAGTITATLSGNASSATTATTATTATNIASGTTGQIPYQSGAGTTAFVGVGTASYALVGNGAAAPSWLQYTNANTTSTIVQRDASGNFSAGTITASLTGTASTATNVAGGTAGQLHYQSGVGTTAFVGVGTSGWVLLGQGTSAPQWIQATNTNTASTIVQRDASGNFSAGTITATLSGSATSAGTATTATTATNIASGTTGQIPYQSGAGTTAFVGVGTAGYALTGNGAASPIWTQFTNANTASTIVQRDASGNFSAGTITATLSGSATSATTATTATNIASGTTGQIPYQSSAGTTAFVGVGTASYALVGNGAAAPSWLQYTNANTASTIVQRDASGNFSAGTITATLSGSATSAGTATTATTATNIAGGTNGQIPYNTGAGATSFIGVGTSGYVLTGAGAALPQWTQATSSNTVSTIVQRDASGNFSAGTITATLSGNASSATTATTATTATNIAGGGAGQIHYQSGAGTTAFVGVGTASYALVGNGAAAPSWLQYTNANTASTIVQRDASGNFSAGTITATLSGAATSAGTATTATNIAGGSNGAIPYNTASGTTSFIGVGTSGWVLTGAGAGLPQWTQATSSNTASTIVQRDASGNFSAGTITASTGLTVSAGGASITGNLSVTGNLLISGNVNVVNSNVLVVDDPIVYIGDNNPADAWDMGLVASYTSSGYKHTGFARDNSNNTWTIFDNLVTEPSETINWAQAGLTFGNFKTGNIAIASGLASTTSTTGALIVTGGAGISGDMNVGGNITGTWNGTTISVAKGGTGLTSGTSGGVLYYSATGTLASSGALAASALVVGGGAGVAPSTITTGTGVVTALGVAIGSAGAFVTFNGALGTPSSGTLTNCTFPTLNQNTSGYAAGIAGGATGQIVYQTGANASGFVGVGTAGYALTGNGAASPIWTQFTNANTASTIVQRDASGNFSAGTITATLSGSATSAGTATTATTATNIASGTTGQIPYQSGAGATAFVGVGTASYALVGNGAAAPSWLQYTNANTASTLVQRDASGNFSAGTITASLTGTASTATNVAGGALGQLHYQSGTGTTAFVGVGTAGYALTGNGAASPIWTQFTNSNTASTIVQRDASGNFSAGTITATLSGSATSAGTATTATTATNIASGTAGQIPYQSGAGATAFVGVGTASYALVGNGAAAPSWLQYTNANTASTLVQRDASGNFSAGTITASLTGTASTATNVAGGALGQLHYQSGTGTTAFVGVGTSGWVLTGAGAALPQWTQATNTNTVSTIVQRDASGNFSAGTITATLSGSATSAGTATTATNIASGTTGQIPYQSGAGTTAFVGVGTASYALVGNGAAAPSWLQYTNANTASTLVQRDASGNFSAGTITATLSGSATSAGTATTATTATNIASGTTGQIPYQSSAGTTAFVGVGTASYALVGNGAAAPSWLQYTNANTASTLVQRDASGNFSAGTITATLSGSATSAGTATTATNIAGGSNGAIPYNTASGTTAFIGVGTSGYVLTGAGAALPQWTQATSSNTASTIVQRDASGNFSAGTITATLSGSATSAGTATTATNLASGTAGALAYQTGAGATSFISAGASGTVLTGTGGTPAYSASPTLTTSLTVPVVYGGTAAGSSLTLQSTSGAGTSDSIIFKTGSAATAMTINTSGSVGIGTSIPNRQLTLTSSFEINSTNTQYLYFGPNGTNLQGFIGYNGNGNTDIGARTGYGITFATNTSGAVTERMRIDSSGNVGIGTTTPLSRLAVVNNNAGQIALSNSIIRAVDSVDNYVQVNVRNASATANASSDFIATANNGTDTTNYVDLGINGSAYSVGTWTINGAGDAYLYSSDTNLSVGTVAASKYINFFTGGTLAANERMRIDANGNMGIGTASIAAGTKLYVSQGNVRIGEGSNNVGILFSDGTYQKTAATSTTPGGSTGAIQYRSAAGAFAGNETVFYFDSSTNRVGIGTNSVSSSALSVKGDAPSWFNTTNSGAPEIVVGTSITTGTVLGQASTGTYGYIKRQSSDTGPVISFTSTGVGINNVTAPINALDISGGVVIGGGIGYAGTATAPSNGMLVQGTVGIGTSSTTGIPASNALAVFSSMYITGGVYSNSLLRAGNGLSVTSGGATITGATTITGNLSITGNVIVSGNINTLNSNVLVVSDPIIYVGESNPANIWDLGIVASYTSGTYKHTGMVRNQSDGVWTFFDNLVTEPSSTVNWAQAGLTNSGMKVGNVTISSGLVSTTSTTGALIVTGGAGVSGDMNVGGNITGTWNGTTISVAKGGTGLTSGTSGGVLYYSATGTLASSGALAASALVVGGGAGAAPSTITTGTGVVTALGVAVGSAGAFVTFNGALGTPSSGTLTNCTFPTLNQNTTGYAAGIAGGALGQLHYQTGANTTGFVGVGTSGWVLTGAGSALPQWTQATNANTASTIVQRDASGNFSAGTITATLSGSATSAGTATTATTATNIASGTTGQIPYQSSAGTTAFVGVGTASYALVGNGAAAPSWLQYTNANTASTIVQRDASGNFSAGTITASLTGTASTATNVAGGALGQLHYQTGASTTGFVGVGTSGWVLTGAGSALPQWTQAINTNTASTIVQRDASGNFSAGTITATLSGSATSAGTATTATNLASGTAGAIPYQTGAGATSFISAGASGTVLTGTGGTPAYSASPTLTTSLTVPIVYGGTAAGSTLTIQSTSGTGTSDSIIFKTGNAATAMTINTSGNVGIGTTTPAYKLEVSGSFAATTKSFLINHPTKKGKKLRYGSLEGPENGVYIRGRAQDHVIELPDYWVKLVDPDSITVNLTPIGTPKSIAVKKIENNKVYLDSGRSKTIDCYFTIFAERVDVEKLQVEI